MKKYYVVAALAVACISMTSCKKDPASAIADAKTVGSEANDAQEEVKKISNEMRDICVDYHKAKDADDKSGMESAQQKYDEANEKVFNDVLDMVEKKKHADDAAYEAGQALKDAVMSEVEKKY